MTGKTPKHVPFPTKDQVLTFIRDNNGEVGKREIARAFNISGAQRSELRALMRQLEDDGAIERGRGRRFVPQGSLPEVTVLRVTHSDAEGDLFCRPENWPEDEPLPHILFIPDRRNRRGQGGPEVGIGDRILARLARQGDSRYEAKCIRCLSSAPTRILGILAAANGALRLRPTNRKDRNEYVVEFPDANQAHPGDLVEAELLPGRQLGLRRAKVIDILGEEDGPRSISLVAIHSHDIPVDFPQEAIDQAEAAGPADLKGREDLRDIPLITIDGADARDFDDAVYARAYDNPANPGGWVVLVAIADVAHYVRPGSPLDTAAKDRGNSVYFPDRVVPMLPEALSNGWCSLRPQEERGCMAVWMTFDKEGEKLRHHFVRGLMRSAARLTYEQVQAARDGFPDDLTGPLAEPVIAPLYGAFKSLLAARHRRGTLELDLPERKVVLDENGVVKDIVARTRLDSHRLIEEFMVSANVAAAETLEDKRQPCMYRIHDQPTQEKLEILANFLETLDIPFNKGSVKRSGQFNGVLAKAKGTASEHMVNEIVLRSQAQAEYNPDNIGHFGLALRRYAHFTSPIRRYADLLVHRALIRGLGLGKDGLPPDGDEEFDDIGQHITATERRAAVAERDAVNRFTVSYMASHVGAVFPGRISGVTRAGLFVALNESGADGLIPIGTLPNDFYVHDEGSHSLRGQSSGWEFRLGGSVQVLLKEANPVSGGLLFELREGGEQGKPGRNRPRKVMGRPAKGPGRTSKGRTATSKRAVAVRGRKAARTR